MEIILANTLYFKDFKRMFLVKGIVFNYFM